VDPLAEIREQQYSVFLLIVQFQRNVATSVCRHAVLQIVGDIVDCVKVNFCSEERWLLQRAPRSYRAQCRTHREVIAQLHAYHRALANNGIELSDFDVRHGLDALVMHYLVDDRFREDSLFRLVKRASHKRWRLK
jgi:hypothetical protein